MQINKVVHAIKTRFHVTTPAGAVMERSVYSYLIYGTSNIFLIDAGIAGTERAIFDYIRKTDRRPEDIALVIQTHSHPDHIGATRTIKGETGCSVAAHPAEKAWIEDVQLQARERPVPGFDSLVAGSLAVDRTFQDGEVFDLGCGLKLQIFHTPGHSRGSISILLLGYMALFTGDAVPVPGEMPVYEDALQSVASVKKLMGIKGVNHMLPSWDEPRRGEDAYRRMDEGLRYLQRIHEAVRKCSRNGSGKEPLKLCKCSFSELGLPPEAANPIAAKSFAAHLGLVERENILA